MHATPPSPNHLLASLPVTELQLFRPYLETVELAQGQVLAPAGDRVTRVLFPHSGVISLVVSLSDGTTVDVATIGRDSVFGASAALNDGISLTDALVQIPGIASALSVERLRTVAQQSVALRRILVRHGHALFVQAQQSAACNATHSIEARLARWLLRLHDLSDAVTLPLTQDLLAQMIGVKRNSVSTVAHLLQERGIIKYARGHIEIIDLAALENASCECYAAVNSQHRRLFKEGE